MKFILLFGGILLMALSASAQVKTAFTPRYSASINGDVAIIANNITSEHPTNNFNGNEDNQDGYRVFVDIDTDNSTFNSSSANFANPEPNVTCLNYDRILLYWSASDKEYDGSSTGDGGSTEPSWRYDQVKLMLPGQSTYNTVTADEIIYRGRDEHFFNDPYVCVKDITSQVASLSNPYGKFQVGNIKATEGNLEPHGGGNFGVAGGWQIVFVYESNLLVKRNITLFDGYAHIQNFDSIDVLFDGFLTVPMGPVNADLILGSIEGDRILSGDSFQILNPGNIWESISTSKRDADNFFNSRITVDNQDFLNRNPASINTLGFDASIFELKNSGNKLIDNGQTSATFRATSGMESYGLFLLGFSVEVFEPSLGALNFTTNVIGSTFDPGDDAPVEIRVKNVGNDNIQNLEIALTLPPQVEFLNTDPLPPGVTFNFDLPTRELRFFVEDGFTDVNDPEYELDFNLFINNECVTCSADIDLQAFATFTGETNPNMVGTLSSGTVDACGIGNQDPTILTVIPVLSLGDASTTEGNDVPFAISSSHLLAADAILNLTYTNVSTTNTDYAQPATYTVPTGTGNTIFNIPTIDDIFVEGIETFELSISSTDPITILDNTATGTISDNDVNPCPIPNGGFESGTTGWTLNVGSFITTNATRVHTGSSAAGIPATGASILSDNFPVIAGNQFDLSFYTKEFATSGTIDVQLQWFNASNTQYDQTTFNLPYNGFDVYTSRFVSTTIPAGATSARVLFFNNINSLLLIDTVCLDVTYNPEIYITDATADEGNNLTFTVFSTQPLNEDIIFDLVYTNITTEDIDYTTNTTSVTIPSGSNSVTFTVATIDDTLIEPTETLEVTISTIGVVTIIDDTGVGSIEGDDIRPGDGIAFSNTNVIVTEGTDDFAVYTITLTGNISENVTVDYTTNEVTALHPGDFVTTAGTLTFTPTVSSFNIQVPITDDTIIEVQENFSVTLSNIISNLGIGFVDGSATNTANGTINDDDANAGDGIAFTNTNVVVTEGTDAFAVFNVTLTGNISENVTVDYTTNEGAALNPGDFVTTTGTLTFTPTENSFDILVPITDDMVSEPTEAFTVILSNIQSNIGIGFIDGNTTNTANGTINDNDMAQIMVNPYEETITILCGDAIPEVPTLVFTGGCGNYTVDFTEVEDFSAGTDDFSIVRTWDVTDACGNTASFQQIIFVVQRERSLIEIDICTEDEAIDLINLLPTGFDTTGIFIVTQGDVILTGSTFEPNGLELGEYMITYESITASCNYFANIMITVNADCLPCDINDLIVSKTITINGDGINDIFEITGLETCGYTYNLKVFNRWGTMVFESQDYRNNWAGNSPGGSFGVNTTVPTGTYYYIIAPSDSEIEPVNGYIYIGSN